MRRFALLVSLAFFGCGDDDPSSPADSSADRADGRGSLDSTITPDGPLEDSSSSDATRDVGPDIMVNLPGSIDGVEPESLSNHPPVIDGNGNLYRVTESVQDDGNNPRMMRSTNGGETGSEADEDNRPSARDLEGCWQLQVGTRIYYSVAASDRVWFAAFNTSDAPDRPDEWVIDERVVEDLGNSGGVVQFSSLAHTSDGQIWLFYSGTVRSGRQSIEYRRRSASGSWSEPSPIGDASGSWTGPRGVVGANDTTYVFYTDYENAELYVRTLDASGNLSNATRLDVDGLSDERIPHTNAIYYDAAGVETLVVGFTDTDGALWSVTLSDGAAAAPVLVTSGPVLEDPSVAQNDGTVAHFAVDGTTAHVVWVDDDSGDIFRSSRPNGGQWADATRVWDSGSNIAWWVYANVYERGNRRRLGYTYDVGEHPDDEGNIEYNEVTLGI
ncbi:MAG: hypothetical protein AAGF12_00085 [Myxococcota bacterium]